MQLFESSIMPPLIGVIIILAMAIGYLLGKRRTKKEIAELTKLNFKQQENFDAEDEIDLRNIKNKDELLLKFKEL